MIKAPTLLVQTTPYTLHPPLKDPFEEPYNFVVII